MKSLCLISILFSSLSFNLNETSKNFSYLTEGESEITPSVVVPVIPPIGPITPIAPEITDKSTSFADAKALVIGGSCIDAFQTTNDEDYYVHTASYTNYCYFNITSNYSSNVSDILVFSESDLINPIYSYTNSQTIDGDNLSTLPAIYVKKGEKLYFKVTKQDADSSNNVNSTIISTPSYTARLISGNVADVDSSYFLEKGYISDLNYVYNGTDNIYVYFDESTDEAAYNYHAFTYKQIVLDAINIWNDVGVKQWVVVNDESDANTIISCVNESSETYVGVYVSYFNSSKIVDRGELNLNRYYMDNYNYNKSLFTCVHELGHGLGLGHIDYNGTNNVMNPYVGEYNGKLGQGDLAAYRYLWG